MALAALAAMAIILVVHNFSKTLRPNPFQKTNSMPSHADGTVAVHVAIALSFPMGKSNCLLPPSEFWKMVLQAASGKISPEEMQARFTLLM